MPRKPHHFDNLPIDHKTLNPLLLQFKKIIRDIKSFDEDYVLQNPRDKAAIQEFVISIVKPACEELLDKEGNIKDPEAHELLDNAKLIGAHVSGINQQIRTQLSSFCLDHSEQSKAFDNYLNANRTRWEKEYLQKQFPTKFPTPSNNVDVLLGVGIAGLLTLGSFALKVYTRAQENSASNLPQNNFKPF